MSESEGLETGDTGRLDAMRDHDPGQRHAGGLVLEPGALHLIFADIDWPQDVGVFAIPNVKRDRLHLYFFAGREARRLDGHRQAELTHFTLGHDIIAAEIGRSRA